MITPILNPHLPFIASFKTLLGEGEYAVSCVKQDVLLYTKMPCLASFLVGRGAGNPRNSTSLF